MIPTERSECKTAVRGGRTKYPQCLTGKHGRGCVLEAWTGGSYSRNVVAEAALICGRSQEVPADPATPSCNGTQEQAMDWSECEIGPWHTSEGIMSSLHVELYRIPTCLPRLQPMGRLHYARSVPHA